MRELIGAPVARRSINPTGWGAILLAIILAQSICSHAAHADITCRGTDEVIPINMPTSITVSRDAAIGQVISDWRSSAPNQSFYQCTLASNTEPAPPMQASGVAFQPVSLTKSNLSVMGPRGINYAVWNTNVPGLGIAIGVRVYVQGSDKCGWQAPLSLDLARHFIPSPWVGSGCEKTSLITNDGGQVEMAFVKTAPMQTGTVTGRVIVEGASITSPSLYSLYSIGSSGRKKFSINKTAVKVAACRTADVSIDLGSHKQSSFKGIGSTTPTVAFNVDLHACPAGLNTIRYEFIPLTAVLDRSNGVLALSADSTATGIGVQLKDRNGSPLKYNTQYTLAEYDRSTGGTYNIPLKASYYQKSTPVKAGTANSLLTFTMSYQ